MRKAILALLVFMGMAAFAVGVTYVLQAGKEVAFLCHYFEPGTELSALLHFMDTVELSEVQESVGQLTVSSVFWGNSVCTIDLHQQKIAALVFSQTIRLELFFTVMGTVALSGLISVHILLAAGKPYGEFAWGGVHKVLPKSLRIGSGISATVLVFAIFVLLNGGGLVDLLPSKMAHDSLAAYTTLFLLSALGNTQAKSSKERKIMIPLSILLVCCFYTVMAALW